MLPRRMWQEGHASKGQEWKVRDGSGVTANHTEHPSWHEHHIGGMIMTSGSTENTVMGHDQKWFALTAWSTCCYMLSQAPHIDWLVGWLHVHHAGLAGCVWCDGQGKDAHNCAWYTIAMVGSASMAALIEG